MKKKKKKSEKTKTVYYDDGSTIHDMSGLRESRRRGTFGGSGRSDGSSRGYGSTGMGKGGRSTFKEVFSTYMSAVRAMIKPLLVVLFILLVLYILIRLITGFAV